MLRERLLTGALVASLCSACGVETGGEAGAFGEVAVSASALTAPTYLERRTGPEYLGTSDPNIRRNETAAYYAMWRAPATLDDFKRQYGFYDAPGDVASATYFNAGDLGFGREMHCLWVDSKLQGACYVVNYGEEPNGRPQFDNDPHRTLENAVSGHGAFATVAMAFDYDVKPQSWLPTASFEGKYQVNFVVYGADGRLANEAQLDSVGHNKAVPQNCTNCHGGRYDPAKDLVEGATFLPFDLGSFEYSNQSGFRRRDQEESFRKANWIVWMVNEHLNTEVSNPMAVKSTLEGWYPNGGLRLPGATFYDAHVPSIWQSNLAVYRDVVAPYCRSCHVALPPNLEISAVPDLVKTNVCEPTHAMPIAEVPLVRLFASQAPNTLLTQVAGGSATCEAPAFLGQGAPAPFTGSCLYYHRSTGQTDYVDIHGRAKGCDAGAPQNRWFDQCRDGQGDTEEVACVPGHPTPNLNGMCQYRDRRSHHIGSSDAHGESRACTMGSRAVWYEQCRDRVDSTEEFGCVQTF